MATITEARKIPALPSTYAGVKFRSRLEARWAYYFDIIGLPWIYEPDGYALKAGNYLPDFKCFDFFVEVKPNQEELDIVTPKLIELSEVMDCSVFAVVEAPTAAPQKCWTKGKEDCLASFCHYAFQGKGWKYPYQTTERQLADEPFARLAATLVFGRDGIAEADHEAFCIRNQLIIARRDAYKKAPKFGHVDFPDYYETLIRPIEKRLAAIDKKILKPSWTAAE